MVIAIDADRLLGDLAALRRIGACGTGVVRRALSATDVEARRWLAGRMQQARLRPHWDPVGNLFGLAGGDAPSVLIGSHSDTQPEGGWLDGAYGVICGLEVARAANAAGIGGISVVSFSDEEGCFAPLLGSRYWTGAAALAELHDSSDEAGRNFGAACAAVAEMRDAEPVDPGRFRAYLEPHIEQGPVLDRSGERIGVVTGIVGFRQVEVIVRGDQNHAGATPMQGRRDAFQQFVQFVNAVQVKLPALAGDDAVWTFGQVELHPNASSVIPGRVRSVLQIRSADVARMDAMAAMAVSAAASLRSADGVDIEARVFQQLAPIRLDPTLADMLASSAAKLADGMWRRMQSGALHDAAPVSTRLPAAMLFVPSIGGRSHCFEEDTRPDHLVLGCQVLADTVAQLLR